MTRHVAILHGWSDTSKSFEPLARFLRASGYNVTPIWLGNYISQDDDVAIEDVAKLLDREVRTLQASGELSSLFDLIVHSTGALVAREWLSGYFGDPDDPADTPPVRCLVMLAPANFGSRLASVGKSKIGRAFKGWDNGFETGTRMLNALELSSKFTWDLACRDVLVPDDIVDDQRRIYGDMGVLPFVITGSRAYEAWPRSLVNEYGSDGTVRVAAANLNVYGTTIDFTDDVAQPSFRPWPRRFDETIPIAVLPDRDHTSITLPGGADRGDQVGVPEKLGDLVLVALRCDDIRSYRALAAAWTTNPDSITERTAKAIPETPRLSIGDVAFSDEAFHQYMQVNVHVVDDHGADVDDFFLEYPTGGDENGRAASYFQSNVLERVDTNSLSGARRTLFIDRTDLMDNYYNLSSDKALKMRVVASPIGQNVGYFVAPQGKSKRGPEIDGIGLVTLHGVQLADRWLHRNSTHLVKIVIPRVAIDAVFRMEPSV